MTTVRSSERRTIFTECMGIVNMGRIPKARALQVQHGTRWPERRTRGAMHLIPQRSGSYFYCFSYTVVAGALPSGGAETAVSVLPSDEMV